MSKIPEYKSWAAMRQRCSNPSAKHYRNYGGRAVIGFHEYPNEELWDAATGHLIEPGQFTGFVDDLLSVAKLIARAQGMKCQKPSGTGPADQ